MPDPSSAPPVDPAASAALERLLVELRVPGGEGRLWREAGRELLSLAGGGPVQPRHVDQALEAALARSADRAELQRLRRLGAALAAAHRATRPQPPPTPVAPEAATAAPVAAPRARPPLSLVVIAVAVAAVATLVVVGRGTRDAAQGQTAAATPSATPTPAPVVPDIEVVNRFSPGAPVDLTATLARGKTTLVEFMSNRCQPSREMQRVMDYLAARRGDLAIRQVDIDRPFTSGVDFDSPVAEQYEVHATPSFIVYDGNGYELARGERAKDMVRQWYHDEQLVERAERVPEIADAYRGK